MLPTARETAIAVKRLVVAYGLACLQIVQGLVDTRGGMAVRPSTQQRHLFLQRQGRQKKAEEPLHISTPVHERACAGACACVRSYRVRAKGLRGLEHMPGWFLEVAVARVCVGERAKV